MLKHTTNGCQTMDGGDGGEGGEGEMLLVCSLLLYPTNLVCCLRSSAIRPFFRPDFGLKIDDHPIAAHPRRTLNLSGVSLLSFILCLFLLPLPTSFHSFHHFFDPAISTFPILLLTFLSSFLFLAYYYSYTILAFTSFVLSSCTGVWRRKMT